MRRWSTGLLTLLVALSFGATAFAQGGGASSTGTIQGRVADAQGAVLPGVTVTASSPSALGVQTAVTSETGTYRFPAVPPGVYAISFELAGFNTLRREGISISLGFTANVNVELALATLQETVTVSGASPVIDTSTTRVQQNFKLDQLQSLPNGRDMWALLAVTPSVQMARIDVGGNRAGTQTGYTAYGFNGQVRVLIEGINTTEGTGGAGFYFDYASLEEAFIGTSGQSAEMPNPGVQSQFIARSGGNRFSGEYHLDWYNNSLQGSNIPSSYTSSTAFNNSPIRAHSNEIQGYYDNDINLGGPLKRDKLWWFGTYRQQQNQLSQPNWTFDQTFNTKLWNPVAKVTYQANQKNKFVGYYQWGQKEQPNRMFSTAYTYKTPGPTYLQDSGSWVYKGEWNGTVSDKLYLEARYGDFGYYFPLIANSSDNFWFRDIGRGEVEGANQIWQLDRDRKQYTTAATYFVDSGMGSHTFKGGAELLKEQSWEGYQQQWGGNIDQVYNNGVSNQVIFALPTATKAGSLDAHDSLTSRAALDQIGAFVNDTWSLGRATMNIGVRFDQYKGWLPEQEQLGASVGPISVQAKTFAKTTYYTWNQFAPRFGITYDLAGDGKTVLKANYGLFWHNPGAAVAGGANPNVANKRATYGWNDINGDRRWQAGEETTLQSIALEGAIRIDPNITDPYTHEASMWVERQLTDTMGLRAGFVYKTEDDIIRTYTPFRGFDAYAAHGVPFNFTDIGVDGVRGTSDDRIIPMVGLPSARSAEFPATSVVMNTPQFGRYKTVEMSLNRRYSNKWSASMGGAYTMQTNFPNNYPQNPNQPGAEDLTNWNFKASGSYDAPFSIRISPVIRHQSGVNFARTGTISTTGTGTFVSGTTFYVEPMNSNREDNVTVFDVRFERNFKLGPRLAFRGMFDMFNITNSHASETITRSTGTAYLKPSAILAPFTMRVGFRLLF